jgi:hypothetical protein
MRRLQILLVTGALAATSATVWAGSAHARRGSDFCDQASNLVDEIGNIDPLGAADDDELQDQIDAAVDAYEELEESAPRRLKRAFRVNRRYYELFQDGGIDFTDPDALEDLAERTGKVVRANQKIFNYLADECDIDAPDVSVPDVSIPEITVPDISIPGQGR